MQRTAQTTVMLTLASAFIFGSVTAFGDTPENVAQTGDGSTPLMLQMQMSLPHQRWLNFSIMSCLVVKNARVHLCLMVSR